jgi:hypothetical protein
MAFFSEVKARLGLDISPFERGLKQAQKSVGGLAAGMGKQFAGTEKVAGALAAAIGLNMQSIANSIARFFTGFSKDAEEQLESLVEKTGEAARKSETALEAAKAKQKQLLEEVTKDEAEAAFKRKSMEERENLLIAERDGLRAKAEGNHATALEARKRILEIETQLSAILDEKIKKQTKVDDEERETEKRVNDLKKANAEFNLEILSDAERLNALNEELVRIIEVDTIDAKERVLEVEKEIYAIEKRKTEETKNQVEALKNEQKQVQKTLADYAKAQRKNLLPSRDDVRSGKRKIGLGARRDVSELDRSEARLLQLQDAEARKREELENARSDGDRARIIREGRQISADREAEEGRVGKLRGGLEGRVSDIETDKASLQELKNLNAKLDTLNAKFEPTSV